MSLMNRLSQLARSQQGRDLLDKAKTIANDPKTREKIDGARDKFSGHVDTAKQKMAEKKAKDAGQTGTAPTYGEESPASTPPLYGEEGSPPDPTPTYGEEGSPGAAPAYGEDGPKAA